MEKVKKSYKGRKPLGYNKRSEEQRAYDLAYCSNLFLRGYSYRDIAQSLNADLAKRGIGYTITFQMVYYDLQQCLIEWKRERFDNIDDYITQELRKLDKIETELWEAWENSKTGKRREKNRTSAKPRKVLTEDEKTTDWYGYDETTNETSAGNPRFLDLLLNVQQRRAKMLGYDAPVKIEIPGYNAASGEDKETYNVKAIPDDLLFAVVDKIQDSKFAEILEEKGGTQ